MTSYHRREQEVEILDHDSRPPIPMHKLTHDKRATYRQRLGGQWWQCREPSATALQRRTDRWLCGHSPAAARLGSVDLPMERG
jgi:hypothetical protein